MTGSPLILTFGDPQRPPHVFDLEHPSTAAMPIPHIFAIRGQLWPGDKAALPALETEHP